MLQPARALDLQQQRIDRVGQPGDLLALERGPGLRRALHLLPAVPGRAVLDAGRQPVQRHAEAGIGQPARVHDRLVVAGQQALGLAGRCAQAVGLQAPHQPVMLFLGAGQRELAHLGADRAEAGRGPLAAAQPGVPGLVQGVIAPARQFAPARRGPDALAARDRLRQRLAVGPLPGHRALRRDHGGASRRVERRAAASRQAVLHGGQHRAAGRQQRGAGEQGRPAQQGRARPARQLAWRRRGGQDRAVHGWNFLTRGRCRGARRAQSRRCCSAGSCWRTDCSRSRSSSQTASPAPTACWPRMAPQGSTTRVWPQV